MKAWHITGYSFKADEHSPDEIATWAAEQLHAAGIVSDFIERTAQDGPDFDAGFAAHRSEGLLWLLASIRGIDYGDSASYDSGEFPKPIFASDE